VFWHVTVCDVLALTLAFGFFADACAFLTRLSPRAILAITGLSFFLLLASAAGAATSRPAVMAATGRIRAIRFRAGTAATSVSIAGMTGQLAIPIDPTCHSVARFLRQPG
jgi:hypothetical protein